MIALLSGIVVYKQEQSLIIEVSGVGYKVLVSAPLLKQAGLNAKLRVFTYTHVREDVLELYGFSEPQDLRLFELLLSVSGVGPKSALGVFSLGSRQEITEAVIKGEVSFFTGVSRLGKKNAQKIIIELKNKLGGVSDLDLSGEYENEEALVALESFGFSSAEASKVLRTLDKDLSLDAKIKASLKLLGK